MTPTSIVVQLNVSYNNEILQYTFLYFYCKFTTYIYKSTPETRDLLSLFSILMNSLVIK